MSRRPVRVHEQRSPWGSEWFASCTDVDWSQDHRGCNWFGPWRATEREARADAARHRRSHAAEQRSPQAT